MAELILIVEGDFSASQLAARFLQEAGYSIRTCSSTAEFTEWNDCRAQLIVIGTRLRDSTGIELCRKIRLTPSQAGVPIIFLAADSGGEEGCSALEAGADNFLSIPFTARELKSRVQAALRHTVRRSPTGQADIVIDHGAMTLSVRGFEVPTTTLEFRLVNYLARHRGHAFSRDVLLDAVWGDTHFVTPRSVDACIRRVREKIEPDINNPIYLKTVRGIGYRFDGVAVWPSIGENCDCIVCSPSNGRRSESPKLVSRRAAS